jgi:hypothetical protein
VSWFWRRHTLHKQICARVVCGPCAPTEAGFLVWRDTEVRPHKALDLSPAVVRKNSVRLQNQ